LKRILFLVAHRQGRSPGQRFRFEQYLEYLGQNGFDCELSNLLNEKDDLIFYSKGHYFGKFLIYLKSIRIRRRDIRRSADFDMIFIYREALMTGSVRFEKKLKSRGAKIILDFDDAIWVPDVSVGNKSLQWLKRPSKTREILSMADMVFVGNKFLAGYALQFNNNIKIVPSTIDTDAFMRKSLEKHGKKICIGWIGSRTTIKHFALCTGFLKKLSDKYPGKIYIKLISDVNHTVSDLDVRFCKWNKDTEADDLSELDIGIMPLPDDEWSRGKCGFKGLQYMALQIPTVISPVGMNIEIVQNGINGYLASTEEEWIEKLSALIDSPQLRQQIGNMGRKTVEEHYSFNSWKQSYVKYLQEMI
jgi:glycosyltransferase involved in cell wall biosynthesis